MKNCPNLQKSLDWCEGTPQYPGIRRRLYYINKNLIELWPMLERDDFGRVIDAHYLGAFTIAADAAWQYIDINIDKSTVTSEPQGEVPSQTQLNKATFVHNGIDAEATAAAGYLNNADCVFVYEDMIGHFRVLGNNKWRTKITVNQDQGQGTNPASTTINIEVTDMIAPPFYVEGLETEDGEVFPSYDDDALLEPRLTSPSGNTFDIGTIPAAGSTVSKTMHIKGSNLTEGLTLTKSHSGLTISKSSITAEEANAGIDITLTYTKSTSGAGSLNGSLRIYSAEVDKTITVTAAKEADYVQDGLVFHLDGINKGNNADAWTDLIGGVVFPNHGATPEENGFLFGGTAWLGVKDVLGVQDLDFDPSTITIEAAYRDDSTSSSGFAVCSFGTQTDIAGKPALLMNRSYNSKYINGMYLQGTQHVWADPLIDGDVAVHTVSVSAARAFDNSNQLSSLGVNHWSTNKGGRFVGATHASDGKMAGFAVGKIFSIRVYSRQLSETEIRHNQRVDNERFSLGLELPEEDDGSV